MLLAAFLVTFGLALTNGKKMDAKVNATELVSFSMGLNALTTDALQNIVTFLKNARPTKENLKKFDVAVQGLRTLEESRDVYADYLDERRIPFGKIFSGAGKALGAAGAVGSVIDLFKSRKPNTQPQKDQDEKDQNNKTFPVTMDEDTDDMQDIDARGVWDSIVKVGKKVIGTFLGDESQDISLDEDTEEASKKNVASRLTKDIKVAKNLAADGSLADVSDGEVSPRFWGALAKVGLKVAQHAIPAIAGAIKNGK